MKNKLRKITVLLLAFVLLFFNGTEAFASVYLVSQADAYSISICNEMTVDYVNAAGKFYQRLLKMTNGSLKKYGNMYFDDSVKYGNIYNDLYFDLDDVYDFDNNYLIGVTRKGDKLINKIDHYLLKLENESDNLIDVKIKKSRMRVKKKRF